MIAFASDRPGGGGVIYVMNADGSDLWTLNGRSASDAAWSPDGRTIALTQHDGDFEVYLLNADGSGRRNLTRSPGDDAFPVWSAGRRNYGATKKSSAQDD
jgi:dipeptidyl aminopeptidase/acylaminoacyl peptidase